MPSSDLRRDLSVAAVAAVAAAVVAGWFLDVNFPQLHQLASQVVEKQIKVPSPAKTTAAINAIYDTLSAMNTDGLFKLKAFNDLCKAPATFDCKGLTKENVFTLIDGVLKERDEELQNSQAATAQRSADLAGRSTLASVIGVGVSVFSLVVSTLSYLKK